MLPHDLARAKPLSDLQVEVGEYITYLRSRAIKMRKSDSALILDCNEADAIANALETLIEPAITGEDSINDEFGGTGVLMSLLEPFQRASIALEALISCEDRAT